jgi:hypothetical protein
VSKVRNGKEGEGRRKKEEEREMCEFFIFLFLFQRDEGPFYRKGEC